MSPPILAVTGLEKFFGGVHVTCNVDFAMQEGEQSAIIGPNGAGKSTFMNLLTGYHRPDAGRIVFAGRDITGLPPHRVVRRGISRAFQVSSIFGRMTVSENVRAAVQAQMRATFHLFASARTLGAGETERMLALCGLEAKRDVVAGELAVALGAEKLVYVNDVPGLIGPTGDLLSELSASQCLELLARSGVVEGGMIPKLESAVRALHAGVGRVHLVDGRVEHSVVLELFTPEGVGTMIRHADEPWLAEDADFVVGGA